MMAAAASTSLVPVRPVFTESERLALAGFLAGYRGLTRQAYILDLRQLTGWCRTRSLPLFAIRGAGQRSLGNTHETHALSWLCNGGSTPGWWDRGLVKSHVPANADQFFHSAHAQAHSLAGHGYAMASHTHALAADSATGLSRLVGGGSGA